MHRRNLEKQIGHHLISDCQTNKLYLSPLLEEDYPSFFKHFTRALDKHGIVPEWLPDTKDVWCVDYMPVQVKEDLFVQFVYNPPYLQAKKYKKTISDTSAICRQLGLSPEKSDLKVEGGNVVKYENKVIMTTRVFEDNPQYSFKNLTTKLTELLQLDQLIFIPEQPHDYTGHSDGMLRFLDKQTVLVNDYAKEPNKDFQHHLKMALHNAGLSIIEIPTSMYENEKDEDATGDYVNYLQMNDVIFLPIFNRAEDEAVLKQFESLFPGSTNVPVLSNDLAKEGGVINCVTWNVLSGSHSSI